MPAIPAVTVQLPPATPSVSYVPGSLLSMARPVNTLEDLYIKMCIYGKNRVGKTTLACMFPKPLLLVAIEPSPTGGAKSVKNIPGIDVIRVTNKRIDETGSYGSKRAVMIAEELQIRNPYQTVVVDGGTSLQDLILQELLGLSKVPEMLTWGMVSEEQYRDRSNKTREALRPFLDLRCHTVLICQEKDHNPPKGDRGSKIIRGSQAESFFAADLGGATVKWLSDACDYIGQLHLAKETEIVEEEVAVGNTTKIQKIEVETGRIVRRLRTMFHPNYLAGFRSENPSMVPRWIEADTPEQMYDDTMKVINGKKLEKRARKNSQPY